MFLRFLFPWADFSPIKVVAYLSVHCVTYFWPIWPILFIFSAQSIYLVLFIILIIQHTPVHSWTSTAGQIQYLLRHVYKCSAFQWLCEKICHHVVCRTYATLTSPFLILSVTKKCCMLRCWFSYYLMWYHSLQAVFMLLLSWYIVVVGMAIPWDARKCLVHSI